MTQPIFNFQEIFQIGLEIEQNGERFYREASARARKAPVKAVFSELAAWETAHVHLFEKLRQEAQAAEQGSAALVSEGEALDHLRALAGSHLFKQDKNPSALAALCQNEKEALETALRFENEAIELYTAMKKAVPESLGKVHIEPLILEEERHVSILQLHLANYHSY